MQNTKKMIKGAEVLQQMLKNYSLNSLQDYKNAIKEIVQEIALLGLWRSKFFEKAAFYGGTALRIVYQLDRFSEDLDFSLLRHDENFDLSNYEKSVKDELQSFGFIATVEKKKKTKKSVVDSAFIKINTIQHLLLVGLPMGINKNINPGEIIKIRFEVDTSPPFSDGMTKNFVLLLPQPFSIKTFRLEDLFACKLHALLCRQWKGRVKGRDWYDLVWFISRNVSLNIQYLEERMAQSGHWPKNQKMTKTELLNLLDKKISDLDINSAKEDIINFIDDTSKVELWSKDFFRQLVRRIVLL